jgi:hypothetical protein
MQSCVDYNSAIFDFPADFPQNPIAFGPPRRIIRPIAAPGLHFSSR